MFDPLSQIQALSTPVMRLSPENLHNQIVHMSPEEIDQLPFGIVKVDLEGTILLYNHAEEGITGRKSSEVLGRNFFKDVAPCTGTSFFYGEFQEGVKRGNLNVAFDYLLDYSMTPTRVHVRMKMGFHCRDVFIYIKRL